MQRAFLFLGFGLLVACSAHDDTPAKSSGNGNPATGGNSTGNAQSSTGNGQGGNGTGESVGTSRVALDVKSFCNKAVTSCGNTGMKESDCEAMFSAVRVTQDCATGLYNASCDELTSGTGAVASCFPSCSNPGSQQCNGDGTLSVCGNASKALVYDCTTTCTEVGKTGSGKCGAASDGSGSQEQKCLCD